MPVLMDWDNQEHTAIKVTFDGKWDLSDIHRMINKGVSMLETVNHKVDAIFDFTNSSFSPRNLISTIDRMEATHNPNERMVIIVNGNVYVRSILKVGRVLAPKTFNQLHFVDSLEAAYQLIKQYDKQPTS
ncbi:MAG: hypothetical protein LCI00_34095 [Chloroflexi bacterium]|nr:hypothetical protein [Chloroflexota bacterium]MCC6894448.1 hypothetical protein [Anaerolineae bacterium]